MRSFRYILLVLVGIGVIIGDQSVERATHAGYAGNSIFFWPLSPGMFVGFILNAGGHAGHVRMAEIVSDVVNIALYWIVMMFLVRTLRKLGAAYKKR